MIDVRGRAFFRVACFDAARRWRRDAVVRLTYVLDLLFFHDDVEHVEPTPLAQSYHVSF